MWTATHRFVVLAMHVAHQGDEEVQPEEQRALVAACARIGTFADVPQERMVQIVDEACRAYDKAKAAGVHTDLVQEAVGSLGGTFPAPVCLRLFKELRGIAKAHGGVSVDEHEALSELREAWDIKSLA